MTEQGIFDKVAIHLLKQNKKSTTFSDPAKRLDALCKYRGEDGLKCAVGALIPDELYSPRMEGESVDSIIDIEPRLAGFKKYIELLHSLQFIHDYFEVAAWSVELKRLARKLKLIVPQEFNALVLKNKGVTI